MNSLSQYATAGEARVARKLVKLALKNLYKVSVNDGEETTVRRSTNEKEIIDALATTDHDTVIIHEPLTGQRIGSFLLIYGNAEDGSELIADYTDNKDCDALFRLVYGEEA